MTASMLLPLEQRRDVGRPERARDCRVLLGHPRLRRVLGVPEVDVTVDPEDAHALPGADGLGGR